MGLFLKRKEPDRHSFCSAVVPAAGQGRRMGGKGKMFFEIDGVPVIARTLMALEHCAEIDEIIVSTRKEDILPIARICETLGLKKIRSVLRGGETRTQSVLLALMQMSSHTKVTAIHDGARPCVTTGLCARVIQKAAQTGAAAPCLPVTDTVKLVNADQTIAQTLDRDRMMVVQTPQCFEPGLIKGALTSAIKNKIPLTDDCSAIEALGIPVHLIPGEKANIKITTPEDLLLAETIIKQLTLNN